MLHATATFAILLQVIIPSRLPIPANSDHLRAPRDPSIQYMKAPPAKIRPHKNPSQSAYFNRRIPRMVHQIWFGDAARINRKTMQDWQGFAETFGYSYRLWSEKDFDDIGRMLAPLELELLHKQLAARDYWAASDLLRMSILAEQGGIYADLDIEPPSDNGAYVDLATILPMQNVVLMTERDSRSVVDSSVFVGNNFMMAAAHHPLIEHLKAGLVANTSAVNEGPEGGIPSQLTAPTMYATGPFYISRSLSGIFTLLPYNYARSYNMLTYDAARD